MQRAIAHGMIHELKTTIGIQALHFRPGLSYLQQGTDIIDSATGFAIAVAPATASAAAPAPAPGPVLPSVCQLTLRQQLHMRLQLLCR